MKRIGKVFGAALLGAALVLGAMGLNSQAQADEVKLGIFSVNYNSPTIFRMIQQAKADAEALGWTVETHDGQGDQVATNNAANDYIRRGFDALINFAFQGELAAKASDCLSQADSGYGEYAGLLQSSPGHNFMSYASSHDTSRQGSVICLRIIGFCTRSGCVA